MKKIMIDTNFLLIPLQFKVDIFSEFRRICNFNYRLCVFKQTINELRNIIEKQPGKHKKAAQFALKLIQLRDIAIIESEQKTVDWLILHNIDKNTIVATQDLKLKRELLKNNCSIIILRQKKYLQLVERKLYK